MSFIVVFLSGCSLYLLLGRAYTIPKAFGLYFKGPSSSFGLATLYSIWEHQNFPLNKGHAILFVGGTWKVTKGVMVLARGKKLVLYIWPQVQKTQLQLLRQTNASLWHRRLGYMSEKGMKMLLSKGKLLELKSINFDMCENCILGKQKRVNLSKY